MLPMCKIVTIAGQKGGSGKTSLAVNLAASLSLLENKTLLVDCDPMGSATAAIGVATNGVSRDLGALFSGRAVPADAVAETNLGFLDIIPAGFTLFHAASRLPRNSGNEKMLRTFLGSISDNYDYIIIDSPSSFSFLAAAAMAASDWLLIPLSCRAGSIAEFKTLLKMIRYIKKRLHLHLKIAGFVLNRCSRIDQEAFLRREENGDIKGIVYRTTIPEDELIPWCAGRGSPVALWDVESPGARAYLNLAREVELFFS